MKQSRLFLTTLRENPADVDIPSHQLMLRAGLVRQLTGGVYSLLPLGLRVLHRIEAIVRSEMDAALGQEILLPTLQPEELWEKSGRRADYGPLMFQTTDRHGRSLVLGPTHEEVITNLVHDEVQSYRQLPLLLYQVQTKFRDEFRPRAGLLRSREFRMKDAYSFDLDAAGLDRSYQTMYDAYARVFTRLGVDYRAVEADPGAIGGEGATHEFMLISNSGEDTVVECPKCGYASNRERAAVANWDASAAAAKDMVRHGSPDQPDSLPEMSPVATPGVETIDQLVKLLGVARSQIIKVVVYLADGEPVAACLRGDFEVNEVKLKNILKAHVLQLADGQTVLTATGRPVGFVGPNTGLPIVFDSSILSMTDGVAAMSKAGFHDLHVVPGRDFTMTTIADIRNVTAGDVCPLCGEPLRFSHAIEVGHIFKLGTRYSRDLDATFVDESGESHPIMMGCYGLGTTRILQGIVEQCHDESGIMWPIAVAPYQVHVVPVSMRDAEQVRVAQVLYQRFQAAAVEVLYDDRDERVGVKFKDSDLIGIPVRLTVGSRVREGEVEIRLRWNGETETLSVESAFQRVLNLVK